MPQLTELSTWVMNNSAIVAAMAVASVAVLVLSLWAGHRYLISIAPDHFARDHQPLDGWRDTHRLLRWSVLVGKNLLGAVLILLGIIMFFTPGQGILTLLLGIALADIPGKRAVERRIMQVPQVLSTVNRLRAQAGRPPLEF